MTVMYGMNNNIFPNNREELASMFIGLGVVILVVVVIFNFIIRQKGNVSVPGSTNVDLISPVALNNKDFNSYEVKKGDTLWSIAVAKYKNGFLWNRIALENKIANGSVIEVGQKLIIPVLSDAEIKASSKIVVSQYYTVVRGDSLWKISTSKLGSGYKWTQLWNLNRSTIVNPNKLEVGMKLRLR